MEPTVTASNKVQSCDHKPLQECLQKNNNDRSKCMKEWNEFQEQCRRARKVPEGQECTTCQPSS